MDHNPRIRLSEWLFIFLGLLLMGGSAYLLSQNITLFRRESAGARDAFQADYRATTVQSMLALATPTPIESGRAKQKQTPQPQNLEAVAAATPRASPTSTPTPPPALLTSEDTQKVFLLVPVSHAFIKTTRLDKKGYSLKFRFEVEPIQTPCKFELRHADQVVLAQDFQGSPTGVYEIATIIHEPGLYVWKVSTPGTQSEAREFVIKEQ